MNDRDEKNNINLSTLEFFLIVVIGMIIGCGITFFFIKPFTNSKYDRNVESIVDTYNTILDNYYEDLDKSALVDGAIKGMLEATGDPYTIYMGDEYDIFDITLNGEYRGIGIEIGYLNEKIVVVAVLPNSPAKEVGIEPGDIILSVDGKKLDMDAFTDYIRNSNADNYELTIKRDDIEKKFVIDKKSITLKSVVSKLYEKDEHKIGYIYVSVFAHNTYKQFVNELDSLLEKNIDSLIIDLRDNSGGELDTVTNMISLFLNNDKILYQIEDKNGNKEITYSDGAKDFEYPIVILVNNNTASASEVMSASLKENLNATLVGTQTYGKGTVQYVLTAENGTKYKMTTKKWLTPKGNYINKIGLEPDIKINSNNEKDNQLEKAIDYLIKK